MFSIKGIKDIVSKNNMQVLYDVRITPRQYDSASKKEIVRFQKSLVDKILNIPVFKNDTLLIKGKYYDLLEYASLFGIVDLDSAILFGKDYSNEVMKLYYDLDVLEIQGGMPNIGELVIMKLLTGEQIVFIPDTGKIFNQNWKDKCFSKGQRLSENIYAVPQ